MDTGTKAASIQSCDVAAALLFRIATATFNGVRAQAVDPDGRDNGYTVWLEIRRIAALTARGRVLPPVEINRERLRAFLDSAHFFASLQPGCSNNDGRKRCSRSFQLCGCPVAELCCTVDALIFTPGSETLLNLGEGKGGRGQSPEPEPGQETSLPCALLSFIDFLDGVTSEI